MRVLVLESLHQDGIDLLKAENHSVDIKLGLEREELLKIVADYDAIIIKSVVCVDKELLAQASNLRVVGRAGVGTDNIDKDSAAMQNVELFTVPGGNADAGADYTVMQILCMLRNAYSTQEMVRKGDFRRDLVLGRDLCALTVGVVGLGHVGKKVVKRLKGFGCKVIGLDPGLSESDFGELEIERAGDIDQLIGDIDVLTLHVPLTQNTRLMVGVTQFDNARPNMVLVNASRGAIVDENALIDAVKQKKIAGAVLDVFDDEPPFDAVPGSHDYDNILLHAPGIYTTPHIGASTIDAQRNISIKLAEQIIEFAKTSNKKLVNC